ncbi:YdhK family protein [Bacillus dakarensis]|uniref:YdhK family protein n=1 Tax=Robertmurraya dakarensis TaxID=1926278 RepID=UPI000980D18D|nr:YdhK family protein [Bacillus dakarensis]
MKRIMSTILIVSMLALSACGGETEENASPQNEQTKEETPNENENSEMNHSDMEHSGSGEVPSDLKAAESPTYEVGSKTIIKTGHMAGMEGAEATIAGAYDTIAYAVSYTPTDGGEKVENHKWVIHEEIPEAGEQPLEPGAQVTLNADHMKGMDGAAAEIDFAEETTVYMIDFTPTTGGDKVTNHKWVTESELSPIE